MDLFDTTQIALERAMTGTSARQAQLAENLANANTPGYQRRDVDFQTALRAAVGQGRGAVERSELRTVVDASAPLRVDGSNVDVEREGAALARAGLEHDALVSVVSARHTILRAAIGI
jgi:flagellar basal-body rod protein FlgB